MAMLNNQRVYFVVVPYIVYHQHYKVYRGWYDLNGNTGIAGVIVAIRIPKQALIKQKVGRTPIAKETTNTFTNHQPTYCIQWIGLRENLQETIDFPIKYGAFRLKFSLKPIHWCIDHTPETSTLTVLTLDPETASDIPCKVRNSLAFIPHLKDPGFTDHTEAWAYNICNGDNWHNPLVN